MNVFILHILSSSSIEPLSGSAPQRLCLNGSSGQEVIVRRGLQNVEALTFDPISQLLFWVDAGAQKIEVSGRSSTMRY